MQLSVAGFLFYRTNIENSKRSRFYWWTRMGVLVCFFWSFSVFSTGHIYMMSFCVNGNSTGTFLRNYRFKNFKGIRIFFLNNSNITFSVLTIYTA